MVDGETKDTLTKQAVTGATGSPTAGTVADTAIPLVAGSVGSIQSLRRLLARRAAARKPPIQQPGSCPAPRGRLVRPNMGCFPADTPAATQDGPKAIQSIKPDDQVWGYDLVACEWKLRRVVQTYEHDYDGDLVAFAVAGEVIEATTNHPVWVVEGEGLDRRQRSEHVPAAPANALVPGRWVDAGNLRAGDVLLLRSGQWATISRLAVRHVRQKVYNFQVEDLHTYAVGTGQVLVHNKPVEYAPRPDAPVGKVTKPNDKWFTDRGLDPHAIKDDIGVGPGAGGRYDVFKDKDGNLWVGNKDGSGQKEWWGRWVEE
jgi:Pretoxin HINT domain/Bacterial toxin 33